MIFRGVDHIGIGVGDVDVAIDFYGRVGFSDVLFDYTGTVPGTDAFETRSTTVYRLTRRL
jgi:catechol 2,3-dioxygenase-like lactoylglutathione lyase family enzyme